MEVLNIKYTIRLFIDLLLNVIGAFIYAVTINNFLLPYNIGEGGVTGITTIGFYMFKIPPFITNIVLNGALLVMGTRLLDKRTIFFSLWAIIWISVFLKVPRILPNIKSQIMLPAIFAGIFMGISIAIIFCGGGTIAGSTIIARIMNKYLGITTGTAMLICDLLVAIPSVLVIGFQNLLLTIIELYIGAEVLNKIMSIYGARKLVIVKSNNAVLIKKLIKSKLYGAKFSDVMIQSFSPKEDEGGLILVCTKMQLANLIPIISRVDLTAYIVIADIHSTDGKKLLKTL